MDLVWKRITNSSAVRLAGLAFVASVIEAGSDGAISSEEASRLVQYLWGIAIGWGVKTTLEDSAHKVGLPPPADPTAKPAPGPNHG